MDALGSAGVMGGDDIRVVEPAGGPGLVPKTGDLDFIRRGGRQHLQRHDLIELSVQCLVNDAHVSLAERPLNLVLAQSAPLETVNGIRGRRIVRERLLVGRGSAFRNMDVWPWYLLQL